MATALLLGRSTTRLRERELDLLAPDWEAPAGGLAARPRVGDVPYMCTGPSQDPHLQGQPCFVIEAIASEAEECLVAFACGCRAYVPRAVLVA
jgi:hypothetical protein